MKILNELLPELRSAPSRAGQVTNLEEIRQLLEKEILLPFVSVWPDERDTGEKGLLVRWEISGRHEPSMYLHARRGVTFSQYDGLFDLEIEVTDFAGEDVLGAVRIEQAAATGSVHFSVAPGQGELTARLLPVGGTEISEPRNGIRHSFPFSRTPNLVENPEFEVDFESENAAERTPGWKVLKRKPFPSFAESWNGRPVHVFNHLPEVNVPHRRGNAALSALISYDPQQEYLFSLWARQAGRGEGNHILLDAIAEDGETVLQQGSIHRGRGPQIQFGWNYEHSKIVPAGRRARSPYNHDRNVITFPEETRFLRVRIETRNHFEINALNLQRIESPVPTNGGQKLP